MIPMVGLLAGAFVFQSGAVTESADAIVIGGNDQKGTYDVRGRVVRVQGNDSRIELRGAARRIEVNGNGHRITLGGAGVVVLGGNANRLTVPGAIANLQIHGTTNQIAVDHLSRVSISGVDNVVRWKEGPNGRKPRASVHGVGNRLIRT